MLFPEAMTEVQLNVLFIGFTEAVFVIASLVSGGHERGLACWAVVVLGNLFVTDLEGFKSLFKRRVCITTISSATSSREEAHLTSHLSLLAQERKRKINVYHHEVHLYLS